MWYRNDITTTLTCDMTRTTWHTIQCPPYFLPPNPQPHHLNQRQSGQNGDRPQNSSAPLAPLISSGLCLLQQVQSAQPCLLKHRDKTGALDISRNKRVRRGTSGKGREPDICLSVRALAVTYFRSCSFARWWTRWQRQGDVFVSCIYRQTLRHTHTRTHTRWKALLTSFL